MHAMKIKICRLAEPFLVLGASLLLVAAGCSSNPPAKSQETSAPPASGGQSSGGQAAGSQSSRPSLECYADRTRSAPAPFHLSWKLDEGNQHSDWEADITANTIDGTWTSSSGTRKIHGVRSELSSWQAAFATFPFGSESGHFRMYNGTSAMTSQGRESVNGYDTTKYSIDTSRAGPMDAQVIRMAMGAKGYAKGTAWADETGCVVKFILDEAYQQPDGSLDLEHRDVGMTKR
jgi:hypothetical protein